MKTLKYAVLFLIGFASIAVHAQLQFIGPSAATYNPTLDVYYVVNNAGKDVIKMDRYGQGKVLITGLTAPDNILYANLPIGEGILVLDSTVVKLYDTSGGFLVSVSVAGAIRLQDLVFDVQSQLLYVSDVLRGVIYKTSFGPAPLYLPTTTILASNLGSPASLYLDKPNNRLIYTELAVGANLKTLNLSTAAVGTLKATGLDYVIGLDRDAQGNWYFGSQGAQGVYTWNKYLSGSPKKIYFEPKPMDNIVVSQKDEWCYMCYSCGKVYIATLHIVGPWYEDMQCQNDSFITYSSPNLKSIGTYDVGNQFIAELSDINGVFTKNQMVVASKTDTLVPASMAAKIPTGLAPGTYRLRWRSTKPEGTSRFEFFVVLPKPIAQASLADTVQVCTGNSVVLGTRNSADYSYKWWPSAAANNDTLPSPTITPSGDMWIKMQASSLDNACKTIDSVFIKNILSPSLSVPDTVSACRGDSLFLGKSNSTFTFAWSPDSLVDNVSSNNPRYIGNNSGLVQYTITAAGGCNSSSAQYARIYEHPVLSSTPVGASYFCVNGKEKVHPIVFVNSNSIDTNYYDFYWQTPAQNILRFAMDSLSIKDTGKHVFWAVDKYTGCVSDTNTKIVGLFKDIKLNLAYTSLLVLGVSDPNNVATINWYHGTTLLANTGTTCIPPDSGWYYATVITKDGCLFYSNAVYVAKLIKSAKVPQADLPHLDYINGKLHLVCNGKKEWKMTVLNASGSLVNRYNSIPKSLKIEDYIGPGVYIITMLNEKSGKHYSFNVLMLE